MKQEDGRLSVWQKGMAKRPVVQIFSSDLLRARETARAIGDSQHVAVETLPGLEEIGFGKWEGMTLEEIQAAFRRNMKNGARIL